MWHRWTGNATRGNDGQATRDISLHLGTTRSNDGHVARIQARGRSQGTINGPFLFLLFSSILQSMESTEPRVCMNSASLRATRKVEKLPSKFNCTWGEPSMRLDEANDTSGAAATPYLRRKGTSWPTEGKNFWDQHNASAKPARLHCSPVSRITPPCVSIQSVIASFAWAFVGWAWP